MVQRQEGVSARGDWITESGLEARECFQRVSQSIWRLAALGALELERSNQESLKQRLGEEPEKVLEKEK